MPTLRAVLLDFDGVLIDSREAWFRSVEEAGRRFRGRPVTRAEFDPTFGQGTAADLEGFGFACTSEELDRFYLEEMPRHAALVERDPAAPAVLAALRARVLRLAIVTNTVSTLARSMAEATGLRGSVDCLACSDQVARAKPAPDVVLLALERLRVGAAEAIMVGDSCYDREAAVAAGVRFIGLRTEGDTRIERLEALLAVVAPDSSRKAPLARP